MAHRTILTPKQREVLFGLPADEAQLLNLLAAIVIHWNTACLGEAVAQRQRAKLPVPPNLLAHSSPLGWAHVLLTGEYKWPKR